MASEYGWSITDILEKVYFDDLVMLIEKANLRKIREWRMQLVIVSNPHVKHPNNLFKILQRQESSMVGVAQDKFDATSFEVLKNQLSQNPRFVVK